MLVALDDDYVARCETVNELCRLRRHNDLNSSRDRTNQPSDYAHRVWMQPKFRFVYNQDVRQVLLRLQQQCNESHHSQHSIRRLRNPEYLIAVSFTPLQQQAPMVRIQFKVGEKRQDKANRFDNATIVLAFVFSESK